MSEPERKALPITPEQVELLTELGAAVSTAQGRMSAALRAVLAGHGVTKTIGPPELDAEAGTLTVAMPPT